MKTRIIFAAFILAAVQTATGGVSAQTPPRTRVDAARTDAVRADAANDDKYPASMAELRIPSHGDGMNGFLYSPSGGGNHGVVILLHGFPGNERNIDIGQAARRAGYNVLYFDYRGSWGSGGTFSFANARDDVASALAWVRSPGNILKYRFDIRRIALVGHSMGGWLAFEAASRDGNVACVAGLAAWNIGAGAALLKADPAARKSTADYLKDVTDASAGPLRAKADDLMREFDDNILAYDYLNLAPALKDRSVLLVAGTHDNSPDEDPAMHLKMEKALRAEGNTHVQNITYVDDHPFSAHRVALSEAVVQWLANDCTAVWKARR